MKICRLRPKSNFCQLRSKRSPKTPATHRCCPQTSKPRVSAILPEREQSKGTTLGLDALAVPRRGWAMMDGGGSFGKFVASSFSMADNRNFTSNLSLLASCTFADISSSFESSSAPINVRIWSLSVVTFSSCSWSASFHGSISFFMSSI